MFRKTTTSDVHYPAHESLQEYAARRGLSVEKAYSNWHNRHYDKTPALSLSDDVARQYVISGTLEQDEPGVAAWPAKGPGLGLRLRDIPYV